MTQNERQLLSQAKQGNQESMRAIYLAHKDHLFTVARALLHDHHLAEDVVHDVFVSFARALKDLKLRSNLKGYLSVSVCNKARDIVRTRVRRQGRLESAVLSKPGTEMPEAALTHQELIDQLTLALQEVPLEQREVLLLRAKAGMTFQEIARQQGVGVNTAQGRYRYGLNKLRMLLQNLQLTPRNGHHSDEMRKTC